MWLLDSQKCIVVCNMFLLVLGENLSAFIGCSIKVYSAFCFWDLHDYVSSDIWCVFHLSIFFHLKFPSEDLFKRTLWYRELVKISGQYFMCLQWQFCWLCACTYSTQNEDIVPKNVDQNVHAFHNNVGCCEYLYSPSVDTSRRRCKMQAQCCNCNR